MRNEINPNQIPLFNSAKDRGATREGERGFGLRHNFNDIISVENLLISWREFLKGKKRRKDVAEFSLNFMDNILVLHTELADKSYRHGEYKSFKISDPKVRDIHKASVRDRLVHHAIYRILYPYFDNKFIFDSYSCRIDKGTHRAMNRFKTFALKVSQNNIRTCWILKCDIRKFFASIDHKVLKDILNKFITDTDVLRFIEQIIGSFNTEGKIGKGLPLGNLTSQLLVNIYMNELDHFVKRELKVKYYIRYADDFILLSEGKRWLENLLPRISDFLETTLKLSIHPDKVCIKTLASGVDFLGWVHLPDHRVLRKSTRLRMMRRIVESSTLETYQSYLGIIAHGNSKKVKRKLDNLYFNSSV
jgi:RNA-directed DNA polymerase